MENKEEIHDILASFEKKPTKDIPPLLEEYLQSVAKTGKTLFPWTRMKSLFVNKLEQVMENFNIEEPFDHLTPFPNVENVKYEEMKKRVIEAVHRFNGAPFTVQRICELVTEPQKHYTRCDKFLRGIEKNVMVVSTVDPNGKKIVSESSIGHLVNGMDSNGFNSDNDIREDQPLTPMPQVDWGSNNSASIIWPLALPVDGNIQNNGADTAVHVNSCKRTENDIVTDSGGEACLPEDNLHMGVADSSPSSSGSSSLSSSPSSDCQTDPFQKDTVSNDKAGLSTSQSDTSVDSMKADDEQEKQLENETETATTSAITEGAKISLEESVSHDAGNNQSQTKDSKGEEPSLCSRDDPPEKEEEPSRSCDSEKQEVTSDCAQEEPPAKKQRVCESEVATSSDTLETLLHDISQDSTDASLEEDLPVTEGPVQQSSTDVDQSENNVSQSTQSSNHNAEQLDIDQSDISSSDDVSKQPEGADQCNTETVDQSNATENVIKNSEPVSESSVSESTVSDSENVTEVKNDSENKNIDTTESGDNQVTTADNTRTGKVTLDNTVSEDSVEECNSTTEVMDTDSGTEDKAEISTEAQSTTDDPEPMDQE